MAPLNGVTDGAFRSLPRKSVRPSWSYEIVTAEEQRDTGEIVASNILDAPRIRKRSHRLNETMHTAVVLDGQTSQTATAADLSSMQMDTATVPDANAIHGRLPVEISQEKDNMCIMRKEEQDLELTGGLRYVEETLLHGAIRGQQSPPVFSPPGAIRDQQSPPVFSPPGFSLGLQTGTSIITQAADKLSQGSTAEDICPNRRTFPAPIQIQEVNLTSEHIFPDNDFVALHYPHSPDNLLIINGSCPHDSEQLLNGSTAGHSESPRTPHPRRWILNDLSAGDLSLHSNHSICNVRDSPNLLLPHQSFLENESTPLLPEKNTYGSAISKRSQINPEAFGTSEQITIPHGSITVTPPGAPFDYDGTQKYQLDYGDSDERDA